jgi:hypothetical protein
MDTAKTIDITSLLEIYPAETLISNATARYNEHVTKYKEIFQKADMLSKVVATLREMVGPPSPNGRDHRQTPAPGRKNYSKEWKWIEKISYFLKKTDRYLTFGQLVDLIATKDNTHEKDVRNSVSSALNTGKKRGILITEEAEGPLRYQLGTGQPTSAPLDSETLKSYDPKGTWDQKIGFVLNTNPGGLTSRGICEKIGVLENRTDINKIYRSVSSVLSQGKGKLYNMAVGLTKGSNIFTLIK